MGLFKKTSPWQVEWDNLLKKEEKFTEKRMEGPAFVLLNKLERFIPEKLSATLNEAYYQAFKIIFEKGTFLIEKTYNKAKREKNYQLNVYATQLSTDKRTVRSFTRQARSAKKLNLLVSSVEGVGLGLIGLGIPDIPLFIAMVLKSVYEIALSYGYRYDTEEEKVFILKLIETAMLDGEDFVAADREFNALIDQIVADGDTMEGYRVNKEQQMRATSAVLASTMLYTKFLQGQFIIGVAGGVFDPIFVGRISDYAALKYRRRFLLHRI